MTVPNIMTMPNIMFLEKINSVCEWFLLTMVIVYGVAYLTVKFNILK